MNRRTLLSGSTCLFALPLLVACATVSTTSAASANALMAKITAEAQAFISTVNAAVSIALNGAVPTSVSSAITVAQNALTIVASATGAVAVAGATISTNVGNLIVTAAKVALSFVPGGSTAVQILTDVISLAPILITYANSIINPAVTSAPVVDGGAARRLGIVV